MAEIYWQTLLITLIQQVISIFGIAFNLAIVWVTIRNKNLQNSFGYFLAIYSFCEATLESATFLPTILVLIQIKISISTCFYVSVIQTIWFGTNASFNLLFVSLDRFFAISFPIFYRFVIKRGAGKYAIMMNILSSAYMFVVIYFDYSLYIFENRNSTVYCEPGDQMGGELMTSWIMNNAIILDVLTLVVYIIVGIVLKKYNHGTGNNGNVQHTRRIYKTILVLMGVIFFLYFMGAFVNQFIVPLLTKDTEMAFLYFRLFAQLVTLAGAINAPVLYCLRKNFTLWLGLQNVRMIAHSTELDELSTNMKKISCGNHLWPSYGHLKMRKTKGGTLCTEYRNVLDLHFPFIRTFLVFCHIQKNANNVIVLPAGAKSTNLTSNAIVRIQARS